MDSNADEKGDALNVSIASLDHQATMALEKELETYRRVLPTLMDKLGKYVLIHDDKLESVWETYEDAIQEGYRVFKLQPFLVKQIQTPEQVHFITRHLNPAWRS